MLVHMYVCMRDGVQNRKEAGKSLSFSSYCLIYHSTKNEARWRGGSERETGEGEQWELRQKSGADRDEVRRYETKIGRKKDERGREEGG